eukprot:562266-Pelagomonas_calceolata.AAC.2
MALGLPLGHGENIVLMVAASKQALMKASFAKAGGVINGWRHNYKSAKPEDCSCRHEQEFEFINLHLLGQVGLALNMHADILQLHACTQRQPMGPTGATSTKVKRRGRFCKLLQSTGVKDVRLRRGKM